jgi:predicted 3-demethylubiquinone-9 3-methyltransferase (glyoxalase superfamily)
MPKQKITTFLWFNQEAEEAVNFYTSIFNNSSIISSSRYSKGAQMQEGTLMTAMFVLDGQEFIALNGGPMYQFTPAISLSVACEDQREIDYLWDALSSGGSSGRCGWLKDRFGLSWQIIPKNMGELLSPSDAEKAKRAMQAMLQMDKLDIQVLKNA